MSLLKPEGQVHGGGVFYDQGHYDYLRSDAPKHQADSRDVTKMPHGSNHDVAKDSPRRSQLAPHEVPPRLFLSRQQSTSEPGANIPPELFDNIVSFVGGNYYTESRRLIWRTPSRSHGQSRTDELRTLKMCSLVCLRWANFCRERIFLDTTLVISSYEAAEILLAYVARGSASLYPVHRLIRGIEVRQAYDSSRPSFCHLLSHPYITNKHIALYLTGGPVAIPYEHRRVLRHDSPHWNIPPSIVTSPSLLRFEIIHISDMHLPSFIHVLKYVRHFTHAKTQTYERFTWEKDTVDFPRRQPRRKLHCTHEKSTLVSAAGCTDEMRLCFVSAMAQQTFPLRLLSYDDYQQMWSWVTSRQWPFNADNHFCQIITYHVVSPKNKRLTVTSFRLGRDSYLDLFIALQDVLGSEPQMVLVGAHASLDEYDTAFDLLQLITRFEHFSTLRTIVLEFKTERCLQAAVQPHGNRWPQAPPGPNTGDSPPYIVVRGQEHPVTAPPYPFPNITELDDDGIEIPDTRVFLAAAARYDSGPYMHPDFWTRPQRIEIDRTTMTPTG
ncbi:hypothetical protein BC629DRAFT_1535647, partial [Irpex lacteus]